MDVYDLSYGSMTPAMANQIIPMIEVYDYELAKDIVEKSLNEDFDDFLIWRKLSGRSY